MGALRCALRDLEAGDVGGWVNALGNAKRAIDCQAERFAHCLGLPPCDRGPVPDNVAHFMHGTLDQSRWEAPALLPLIAELNVAPIRVVQHYRGLRDMMEHHCAEVHKGTATNAVEWAELFFYAVDRAMRSMVGSVTIGNSDISSNENGGIAYALVIEPRRKHDGQPPHFVLTEHREDEGERTVAVTANKRCYLDLMNLMLAIDLDNPLPDALRRLVVSAGGEALLPALQDLHVEVEWA